MGFLKDIDFGLSIRWAMATGACLFASWIIVQSPDAVSPVMGQINDRGSGLGSAAAYDQTSSHTMVLSKLEKNAVSDNQITFNLLRQTQLNREPPPIFPEALLALDNQEVSMYGFIAPYDSLVDMDLSMIMPTSQGCQFCVPPSHVEVVFIDQKGDDKKEYISEPVEIKGRLNLWKADSDNQYHKQFLFVMENAVVTPVSELES